MTGASGGGVGQDGDARIRVLVAEDETHLGTILEQFLTTRGFFVRVVRDGRTALDELLREPFDVALLDVVMPEVDGLEVLRQVRERPLPPEIIVITGNGTIETAMAALKLGAYDVLSKPYRMAEIEALVRRAWEKRLLVRERRVVRLLGRAAMPSLQTTFAPLVAVLDMVTKFADSPLPVLLTGEPGTGRQSLARVLHAGGREGEFVRVDCATLDADEQLDALFGAASTVGSPAGVAAAAVGTAMVEVGLGAIELAARGTLYLQNIDALAPRAQALLLQAIEAGTYLTRHDGRRVLVDTRIVASTARALEPLVQARQFDEQLLHRLAAIRVQLPPLRERGADAVHLAERFLLLVPGREEVRFDGDALLAIEQFPWPGNVRELRLAVERAVFLARDGVVTAAALGLGTGGPAAPRETAPHTDPVAQSLADLERAHIADVLQRTAWHQGRAAEMLGISPKTLYRKIREYGFKRPSGRNV